MTITAKSPAEIRRALRLAATLVGLSLSLGACKTFEPPIVAGEPYPEDYRARHPIAVTEADRSIVVFIGTGRGGMTAAQRADVAGMAQTWLREGTGGITIDMPKLEAPETDRLLIVEGAGGLLVPLTDTDYVIDLAAQLHLPVILVARSTLGTINHTLLSIEALRRRGLPLAGVVVNGPETPHNRAAIERYGEVNVIAEIPWLPELTRASLQAIEPELDLEKLARALP